MSTRATTLRHLLLSLLLAAVSGAVGFPLGMWLGG